MKAQLSNHCSCFMVAIVPDSTHRTSSSRSYIRSSFRELNVPASSETHRPMYSSTAVLTSQWIHTHATPARNAPFVTLPSQKNVYSKLFSEEMVVVDRGDRGAALVATQRRRRTTQRSAAQRRWAGARRRDSLQTDTHTAL